MFSGTAAAHDLMAFRDAFVGDDADKQGLGSKGWLFFAKDTGTVYYHNGSSWVDLGLGSGGDGALTDSDDDGLLEAPDHDGIDVEQVEAESVSADELYGKNGSGTDICSIATETVTLDASDATTWISVRNMGSSAFIASAQAVGESSTVWACAFSDDFGSTTTTRLVSNDIPYGYTLEAQGSSDSTFQIRASANKTETQGQTVDVTFWATGR